MAVALTMRAVAADMSVRFWQTAQLVLELGNAKRKGTLSKLLNDVSPARLLVLDEFVYVPCDVDGARVLYQVISVHVVLVGRGVVGLVEGEGLRPVPVGPPSRRPCACRPASSRRRRGRGAAGTSTSAAWRVAGRRARPRGRSSGTHTSTTLRRASMRASHSASRRSFLRPRSAAGRCIFGTAPTTQPRPRARSARPRLMVRPLSPDPRESCKGRGPNVQLISSVVPESLGKARPTQRAVFQSHPVRVDFSMR